MITPEHRCKIWLDLYLEWLNGDSSDLWAADCSEKPIKELKAVDFQRWLTSRIISLEWKEDETLRKMKNNERVKELQRVKRAKKNKKYIKRSFIKNQLNELKVNVLWNVLNYN